MEQSLFDELVEMAHKLQVSRSQVLSQALGEYFARRQNQALLAQINEAYAESPDAEERALLRHAERQHRRIAGAES